MLIGFNPGSNGYKIDEIMGNNQSGVKISVSAKYLRYEGGFLIGFLRDIILHFYVIELDLKEGVK